MQEKETFHYARLYDAEADRYVTNSIDPKLVLGPETQRRFEENEGCAVTICCITYRHEEYIRQALDSFLMQKTNFKFQVFVGEDHGPDGTADIVREYAEKYPDIIVPFLREQNMGAQRNLIDLCQRANSPYIAFCEGDDYWTDEYKLQKQYDYMQAHEDVSICFMRTRIEAPEDWYLRSYYKKNKKGEMIIPESIPGITVPKRLLKGSDLIKQPPFHTSTHFYRWNYDLQIPAWFYEGVEGAYPIFMMQLGLGNAAYIPEITSVYRRSDVGVIMNTSWDDHFLKTRMDYIRFIWNLREYFAQVYNGAYAIQFENRIKAEGYNLLSQAVKYRDDALIQRFLSEYPDAFRIALNAYLCFYADGQKFIRTVGWKNYQLIRDRRVYRFGLRCYGKVVGLLDKTRNFIKKLAKKTWKVGSLLCYWWYSLIPKQKNLWVISDFRSKGYADNTKYFYEYITQNHPEIELYWITKNNDVYDMLQSQGKRVCKCGTRQARKTISHAYVAVVDHNRITDFSNYDGFNDKIKVVQLWHGVGFKANGDGKNVKLVKEDGFRYSTDILVQPDDSFFTRMVKKVKYARYAYNRELFEKYFMLICPGQERVDMLGKCLNIPEKSYFMAGHPRNELLYQMEPSREAPLIMYAPTFRYAAAKEAELVDSCIAAFGMIQEKMEQINGTFTIRLHPHTWRDYNAKLTRCVDRYDRIVLDTEKDIYTRLGLYSLVITDYSSIAMDFAMLDRPTIFHCPDYEWFAETQAGFNLDFPASIPGPMTANWDETLCEVRKYIENPEKDAALRQEKLAYFFDKSANGPDNSERIVAEIKRRIGLD